VKAFVNAITFFPLGSMVRTTRDEIAIVVGINPTDPLHPMLVQVDAGNSPGSRIDASARDASGAYERHIVETVLPQGNPPDMTQFLAASPA
jgi:hypothetical protein